MKPLVPLRQALGDPALLGNILPGPSWAPWRAVLLATVGEPLEPTELEIFTAVTGRTEPPPSLVEEATYVIGRRGGKDRAASVLATYFAGLCDHTDVLAPGERGVVICIGADQRQATITRNYIEGVLNASPVLAQLVKNRTVDTLSLSNRVDIEVRAASFRRLRGATAIAVIASEVAFWMNEESSNPDTEILNAVRPALATTGGPLILISTPYARRGELWETYRRHYGPQGDPLILVAQGASRTFNPTLSENVVQRALERDQASAAAEYLAQFRSDIEAFISREAIDACVSEGIRERPPVAGVSYVAFVDPSGGSSDSMTLAVAHCTDHVAVLDCIREIRPPFSPESAVEEFCKLLKSYGVACVKGDRYGGEFCREPFRKLGIEYRLTDKVRSDLYLNLLPAINSQRVDLLDHARLITQVISLERRTSRAGKDRVDHAPGAHDDVANSVAGALCEVMARSARPRWEPVGYSPGERSVGEGENALPEETFHADCNATRPFADLFFPGQ